MNTEEQCNIAFCVNERAKPHVFCALHMTLGAPGRNDKRRDEATGKGLMVGGLFVALALVICFAPGAWPTLAGFLAFWVLVDL